MADSTPMKREINGAESSKRKEGSKMRIAEVMLLEFVFVFLGPPPIHMILGRAFDRCSSVQTKSTEKKHVKV